MKKLSFDQMQKIDGGGWGCFFAVAGYAGVVVAAVLAPPAGIALALTIGAAAFDFIGSTYAMHSGACR
jgi:hypothetical protein